MTISQSKYLATIQNANKSFSYTFSSDFDFCFQFLQQHIKWNSDYLQAFIENIQTNKTIVVMRQINENRF